MVVLAGCVARPEPLAGPEYEEHWREVLVQTIPRNGYVERNGEYVGVAPIAVRVRTTESGRPVRPQRITATDTASGAYVWKLLVPGEQVPERMLMDIRPFLSVQPGISFGP